MNAGRTFPIAIVTLMLISCWMCGQRPGNSQSAAQESGDAPEQTGAGEVAVVNIANIFKQHPEFKRRLEAIRQQVNEFKKQVAVRQVEIESTQRKLQQLKAGTQEHDDTQLLLARLQTELKLSGGRKQQEFIKLEATLYSDTYGEITEAISTYAKANGIRLVLRANEGPIDPNNQKSVMGAVNRIVVYQADLDITDDILRELSTQKGDKSPV